VFGHHETVAAAADFLNGLPAVVGIPLIPSATPDTPHETARAMNRYPRRDIVSMKTGFLASSPSTARIAAMWLFNTSG
jgi:hypothetical protein